MNNKRKNLRSRLASVGVMVGISLLLILAQSFYQLSPRQTTNALPELKPADTLVSVRIIATGDAMAHLPQTQAAFNPETGLYGYKDVFRWLSPVIKGYDLAIVNFETPLGGEPYKGYPQFSAPDAYAADLKSSGFNFFCCANNHAVDRYNRGVIRTLSALDSMGIRHTGMFRDQADRDSLYPVILNHNRIRIALLNATFSTNGIEPKPPVLVNRIDREQILADLVKARAQKPDVIMMVIHWGDEYKLLPNAFQKSTAQFLADNGVDVIIGHHPHVLQPVEWIKGKKDSADRDVLVIWSLGNFFSNQRDQYRNGGMLTGFDLVKNLTTGKVQVRDASYYPFWVWKIEQPLSYKILPCELQDSLIKTYEISDADRQTFDFFSRDARKRIGGNGVVKELFYHLPSSESGSHH